MGTNSLQADSLVLQPRKKRSFSLPSFGRSSAGGEQLGSGSGSRAEEAVRVQKAAAWQWYTRGVGEVVVPTKRPPPVRHLPPSHAPSTSSQGGESMTSYNSSCVRAASRFKAEARPTSFAPSPAPSTPLYDEFELSGLRTHMADFVERLQHQQIKDIAVADLQKSKPRPNFPLATSVSTDQQRTKAPPVAAATASHQPKPTKLPSSAARVASTPLHMRPFSALHRLFRKVISGSILKSTKNSLNSSPPVYEPEVLSEEGDDTRYHYHHYIHHHHHHYHYDQSPEESIATIPRRRRFSESSGISPRTPSLWEAASDEEEKGVEESPVYANFSRRRRHSDCSTGQLAPKKAAFDEDEGESAKAVLWRQFPRRYESERFSSNKIPSMDYAQPAPAGGNGEFADMKSRRRNSFGNYREEASLERQAEGGGKSAGGTYKLGGGATQARALVRRRHSETSQRPEAVQMGERTLPPGWPYWQSPSARYYVDVPAPACCPPRNAVLPPRYPLM